MDENEIITLGIDINDDPLNQKVEAIEGKISTLQEKASTIALDAQNTGLPGYGEAIQDRLDAWNTSLTDVVRARKAIDQASNSVEQADLTAAFRRKVEMADKYIQDIQKSVGDTQNFVKDVTPAISNCLTDYTEQLKTAFRTVASRVTTQAAEQATKAGSGTGMLSDKALLDEFFSSAEYRGVASQIQSVNPQAASRKVMASYLQSQMPVMLPQYMREDVAGNSTVVFRSAPTSFREMVPPSYQTIPTRRPADATALRQLGSTEGGSERLTKDEQEKLDHIVQRDHRAADAAVAAGIYGRSEGKLYYNPNATRDMVNAMGGYSFAEDIVVGARGQARYGIQDVEDPTKWQNIAKKIGHNGTLDSGLFTARSLHDSFPWYNPGYYDYSNVPAFNPAEASTPKRYVGQIHQSPREVNRGFAEYTLDMMNQGVQITGNSPVKNQNGEWIAYPDIHGPQQASKQNGFVSISPDDFHTIGLNGSMLMDLVHSMPHAPKTGHNDFDDSMIYLKHDERLSDQGLPDEEKAALQAEIENRLTNGYDANGKHYIPTRISKTHTEFMWDKIVDDIGRYELGMAPDERPDAPSTDEIRRKGLEVLRNGAGMGTFDNFKDFAKAAYNASLLATDGEDLSSYWGMNFGFQSNDAVEAEIARRKAAGEITHPQQEQRVLEQLGTPNTKVVVGHFEAANGAKIMDGANWAFNPAVQESFQGRTYGGKATFVKQNLIGMKHDNPNQIVDNDITRAKIAAIDPSVLGQQREQMIQGIREQYGDFLIPGAGMDVDENGVRGDLLVPWNTDFVEADDNIKNKAIFRDDNGSVLNQQQLNDRRSRDYSRWHVSAKTTYDDAGTSSRWLSRQVVNGQLAKAFRNPNVEAYFGKILQDEISHLDDEQYARDVLFGGDQTVDLTSAESQRVRENHINNLIQRYSQGDRLLPTGAMTYSMAAPNPQNVLNEMFLKNGQELTAQQMALHLGENDVVSAKSGSKLLSLIRFPATLSGNVKAANLWNSNNIPEGGQASIGAAIRASFARRGLDEKGLYFNPASPILGYLQGMDFDGDKNGQFDLSSLFNIENLSDADKETFSQMMGYLNAEATAQRDAIMLAAFENIKTEAGKNNEAFPDTSKWTDADKIKYVMENQAKRKQNRTTHALQPDGKKYSSDNPSDMTDYLLGVAATSPMMGQADRATDIIAALYDANGNVDPAFAQALLDHEDQYDVVSTHLKSADRWAKTGEQKSASSFGRSFARIFEWAGKDATTLGQNDDSSLVWDQTAQQKFNARNFDQINLPTISNGAVLGTLRTRRNLKEKGLAINGTDQYGHDLYDWDAILSQEQMPTSEAEGTEGAKLTMMLRRAKAGFLKGDYLALSQEDADAIIEQRNRASAELALATGGDNEAYQKRWRAMGGNVAEQIEKYAYTQRAIEASSELQKSIETYARSAGVPVAQLYSQIKATEDAQAEARKESEREVKHQAESVTKEKKAEETVLDSEAKKPETREASKPAEDKTNDLLKKVREKNVDVTIGDKVPPLPMEDQTARIIEQSDEAKQEQAKAEVKAAEAKEAVAVQTQKTAKEEARELLSQKPETGRRLSDNQIDTLLSLPRETVAEAVASGDWKRLATNGVGQATAEKAIGLLKGSRYVDYRPSSSPELGWKIAEKTNEQKEQEALVATESVPEKNDSDHWFLRNLRSRIATYEEMVKLLPNDSRYADQLQKDKKLIAEALASENPYQWAEDYTNAIRIGDEDAKAINPTPAKYRLAKGRAKGLRGASAILAKREAISHTVDYYPSEPPVNPPSSPNNPPSPPNNPSSSPTGLAKSPEATSTDAAKALQAQLAQAQYGQIMQGVVDFSKRLFVDSKKSEAQINEVPAAIQRLDTNLSIAKSFERQINELRSSDIYKALPQTQQESMEREFDRQLKGDNSMAAKAGRDFMNYSLLGSKNLVENISKANDQIAGTYDPQVEALQKWKDKIAEVEKEHAKLQELANDKRYSEKTREEYTQGAEKLGEDLERLKAEEKQFESSTYEKIALREQSRQFQHNQLIRQGDQLARTALGNRSNIFTRAAQARDSALSGWENYKSNVDAKIYETKNIIASKKSKGEDYSEAAKNLSELESASARAGKQIDSLSGPFGTAQAAAAQFGNIMSNVAKRLGRQLFQKALQETKRFVKEFDASMTTIQMITLKSDQEMSTLGDGLIAKAKELKISISEISQMSAELYRQGLSDEEMDERLDTIAKFSKVSGTKPGDATKLITTAMNTGLVDNAQYAADVVTMLGDSAATNAAQIEKGIEKAGAAAATDGTTYGQLVALLTAVTATTQVTGNVAGTTLNSIFGRMNKVGTNELIYDENGNSMSGSAIAKLLRAQGVATNNEDGSRRSTFSMLYDLAQKYDDMSDDEQRQIATAISGTRQFSNFGAIMTGIREGDIDKYLELIDKSEGITDQKYDVYTKSLQASLDNLRNTWDELVKDLIDKGVATNFIDGITTMIQGVDNLVGSMGKLQASLPLVLTLLGAFAGFKLGGGIGALIGAGAGLVGYFGLTAAGSADMPKSNAQMYQEQQQYIAQRYTSGANAISQAKALQSKGANRTDEENAEYNQVLYKLAKQFDMSDVLKSSTDASGAISDMADSAKTAAGNISDFGDKIIKEAEERNEIEHIQEAYGNLERGVTTAVDKGEEYIKDYNKSGEYYSTGLDSFFTEENGNIVLEKKRVSGIMGDYYSDTEKTALANALAAAGENGYLQKENKKSADEWLKQINEGMILGSNYGQIHLSDEVQEGLIKQIEHSKTWGVNSIDEYYNRIQSSLTDYFTDVLPNPEDAELISKSVLEDYRKQYGSAKVDLDKLLPFVQEVVGFTEGEVEPGRIAKYQHDYEKKKGITPVSIEEEADSQGLEYLGEGTYYIGSDGRRYSYEEAKAIAAAHPTYRGKEYSTVTEANAERDKNRQQDLINAYDQIELEDLTVYNGEHYNQTEQDQDRLMQDLRQDASDRIEANSKTALAYKNAEGQLIGTDDLWRQAEEQAGVYGLLDSNGRLQFYSNESEAANSVRKDYYGSLFRDMMLNDNGRYRDMITTTDASEYRSYADKWATETGRQSYKDYFKERLNYYDANNPVNTTDLSEADRDAYQHALDKSIQQYVGNYQAVNNAVELNGSLYETLDDAISENIQAFTDQILEEYGVSDISELPTTIGDGSRFKWKDEWFDTYEEACEEIERQITALYEGATEAVQLNPITFKAYQDIVSPKVTQGSATWNAANQQRLYADQFMSMVRGSNITSYKDFLTQTGLAGQQLLVNMMNGDKNGELANILRGAVVENGQVLYEDEGLYQALRNWMSGQSTSGKTSVNQEQKGQGASNMLDILTSGQDYYATQAAADQAYDNYVAAAYERYLAQWEENPTGKVLSRGMFDKLPAAERGVQSKGEWLAGQQILNETDLAYLKEAVKDESLYADLTSANATKEQRLLARRLVNNYKYGGTGLASADRLAGLREVQDAIAHGTFAEYDPTVAAQYAQGFSNWENYATLLRRQAAGEEVDADVLETYRKQFEKFREDSTIELQIEGLQTLEQAGELLEGTANLVEQLKKGGRFEIEAVMSVHSELHSEGQTMAMLNNGTAEQQYQAIMELTGATLAQIERNPNEYRRQAEAEATRRQAERGKQLETLYAQATDKNAFRQTALEEGWDITGGDYVLGDQYTVTADGRVLNKTTGLFDEDETRRYQAAQIKATYNGQPTDNVNPYFGKSESYRNLQLAQAAQNIAYGRMSRDEDYQLYDAAVNASGYWTQRMAWLESNNQQGTADYEKAQKNARLEADRAAREAQDSQRLEDLKLSGDTFGYAQEQYRQNNKAGLAANEIYKSLSNADVKSVDDLMSVLGNRNNAQNWKDLLESSPELAKKLSDLGLSFDEDFNWDNSGLLTSSDDAATALSILADAARSASDEFKHEDVQTTGQQYNNAIDYLNGNVLGEADEAVKFEAMRSIFGDAFANEVGSAYETWNGQREDRAEWENNYNTAIANRDYELATRLKENEVFDPGAFNWGANMTEYNRGQAQMLIDNAAYGQYGLTDLQKYNEMSRLFEAANTQGGIAELRKDDALGLYGQLVAGADGFEQWTKGVEALNAAGIALKDFNAESEECQKALGKAGIAVNDFADDHKKMASEMRAAEIETKKLYGENSSEIANRIRQLSKSEKDRAQALKEISANYDKFNQTGYARNQWNAGKKNYKDVASAIGQSEAYVKNMVKDGKKDVITKQLDLQFEIDEQQCLNDAEAQINSVLGQFSAGDQKQFYDFLVQMGINGEFDASNLEAVASQAEGVVAQIINELIAFMAAQSGSVTFGVDMDGDTATVKAKSVKMGGKGGGGYGGGGGGGGGSEKSAAQKLLEKQKRDIARYQHEIKMLEIEEEHYDRSNEYDTHMALLDAEIAKQRELQDLYRNNIGELESMLGSLSPDDDDYDNVLNALYDAKEQLADINNTIDEINAKRITIVTEKQENEDKPQGHKMTQVQNLATRYMDAKEYENYYKAMDLQLEATREQIAQNEGQIAEWENMLTQYQEGSDDWIEIRDKIWAMREENASLQNQALEDVIQMNQQKISQISEELEHGQQFSNHAINMNSTYGDMYNSNQQYADYRRTLTEQNTSYQTNIQEYEVAIDRMRTLMATLDKTSDEWYSARDAIFQYEEAIASAKNAILENNQAIQESRVSELTTNYDHMTSDLQHEIKILQNQKQIYDDDNDYEAYIEMMRKEEQATIEMTNAMRGSLAKMEAEIGNVDQGSDAWWNLHDKILSVREAISDSEVSLENFENQIAQSKIDHLLEKFGRVDEMDQHNLKLIQYQETRYQNAGELTNYGTMLGIENEYQAKYAGDLEDHIRLLKNERDNVEIGSDAYYKLEQSIAKYEEQLRATNNTIEKNNRLIEENQEKIRQTVMAVENTVDKEYRARIQKTKEMLAAEVNMQNTILDTIKKRYQDEFNLEKQRIAKLKESLNQEKSLINERLNARKNAVDQADQYEELAEYKRQLALLSADPTRTKEAKELQKRISDMEKDMAYQTAAAEATAEGERIDDQMKAYDDYINNAQEDLNMLLADSTALMADAQDKFGYNVAELMAGSWVDLLTWLQENNDAYRNATEELQTQMVNSWEDTWKKMNGIIDTYWEEISAIIGDETTFMDYMKESDTYKAASDTGKLSLEYRWEDSFEDMLAALVDNADYDHEHDLITDLSSKLDEAKDWTYKVELAGATKDLIGSFALSDYSQYGLEHTPVNVSDIFWDDLYAGVGKIIEMINNVEVTGHVREAEEETPTGKRKKYEVYYVDSEGNEYSINNEDNTDTKKFATVKEAQEALEQVLKEQASKNRDLNFFAGDVYEAKDYFSENNKVANTHKTETSPNLLANVGKMIAETVTSALTNANKNRKITKNAEGGVVDYTGLAWVDGTLTKPESFLDAVDTKHIAELTDMLDHVDLPSMTLPNLGDYGIHSQTIGDINITINQAELGSDADVDAVARKVGKAFSKQLSKQGLNLAQYAF